MRFSAAAAVVCLTLIGFAGADEVKAAIRKTTDIPAQGLGPALQALARERGFQIVYASHEVNSLRTQGARGELTSDEALKQILSGTGLTYRTFGEDAVSIVPISSAGANPASAPPADRTSSATMDRISSPFVEDHAVASGEPGQEGFRQRLRLAQADTDQSRAPASGLACHRYRAEAQRASSGRAGTGNGDRRGQAGRYQPDATRGVLQPDTWLDSDSR
jgi:iron complex outermembrane recepter protein